MKHNTIILALGLLLLTSGFAFSKGHHKTTHTKKSISRFHPTTSNAQLDTLRDGTPGKARLPSSP